MLAPPVMSKEEALKIYERAKTPVEPTHMPAENKGLPAPSRSAFPESTERSELGAAETLALYTDSIYYAYATGDARPALEFIDTEQCINCAYYIQKAMDGAEEGHYGMSPELTYDTFYYEEAADGDILVRLPFQHGEIWESKMGKQFKSTDPGTRTANGKLHWNGSAWVLVEFSDANHEK